MKHSIDLSKYKIRTDLAIETLDVKTDVVNTQYENGIEVTDVFIDESLSRKTGKKIGKYITIEFDDITDHVNYDNVLRVFTEQLKHMLAEFDSDKTCLIVGLGNENSTPDSLGPKVVAKVLVTRHLFMIGNVEQGYRCVSALSPGVLGQTGLETSEMVKSVVDSFKPDFVIVIDALASQSIERVNKTIQLTNTGIHPGSGVGNSRKEISRETLGIPCIAIGVPTVVDAVTIVSDTIDYMYKHYAYSKNISPLDKLIVNHNYKKVSVDVKDKEKLFGMVGKLNNIETKQLIYEVLSPIGYNLMVTTKEVDYVMDKLSLLISSGINASLHKNIK